MIFWPFLDMNTIAVGFGLALKLPASLCEVIGRVLTIIALDSQTSTCG